MNFSCDVYNLEDRGLIIMDHLRCVVERITYQNETNGFSVIKCRAKGYNDLVTVVGNMPDVHVGSVLTMEGRWRVDRKFGRQFSAEKWEETLPTTTYGIEKYLGSGLIKGVGPKFAKCIVQKFGKDTLEVIETDPDSLIQVEGIGKKRVERIKKGWQEQREIKNIMLFLQSNDVSTAHAERIYKTYGNDSIKIVEENPYRLVDDIWGIGFKTADQIATKMGIEKDRFIRLRSGILYTLNKLSESGHCYAVREQLIGTAAKLLDVDEPELEMTLDEMMRTSMIDIMLMYNLLKALPDSMTLILVGDTDQLPSVGAGNVHRINHGEMPDLRGGKNSDFFFTSEETNEDTAAALVKYCTRNLPRYYHADAFRDIQVLTPMQRGICGAANLNQLLQEALNPSGIYLRRGGTQYRLRDKVMQIRNDYDKDVFNGDIGIIVRVDTEDTELTVDFDGREVVYDVTELDELVLAYATTIHKAQGSEYPIVVMPFTMSHYVMLQRNLLYTGVTRAKKILVLIGEKKAVAYAVRNETTTARNTKLAERLQEIPAASNPNGGVPSGKANNTRGKSGVVYRMSEQEREQLKVAEREIAYGDNLFARLAQSKFRSSFSFNSNDRVYVKEKGMDTIRSHAQDFVQKRLAPAEIPNDGKQTPMKGHPVFIAQHATATCCRGCLEKWHKIPKGCELTEKQQEYVVGVLMEWIERQMNDAGKNR